jgi:hypothetical protein
MILPPGHAQQIRQRRAFSRREKGILGGVLAAVAAIVAVLIISVATADKSSAHGCINVSLPYSTGGAQIYRCGNSARSLCASVGRPGLSGSTGRVVASECRKAGIAAG